MLISIEPRLRQRATVHARNVRGPWPVLVRRQGNRTVLALRDIQAMAFPAQQGLAFNVR